ncbi:hypothetical protein CCACVL1_25187 [Corchorus capsularis]|uniref:Uncharacterized protein n=1 Tax=Corchorus capsularis TaxID=210143 RepID=A0A1R3GLU5_COCAP|nr:hypothetical protein CCACVL1_25187 [Corchorus capsularis]
MATQTSGSLTTALAAVTAVLQLLQSYR